MVEHFKIGLLIFLFRDLFFKKIKMKEMALNDKEVN